MTIVLTDEQLEEYRSELRDLKKEENGLNNAHKEAGKRLGEISDRIKDIAIVVGSTTGRVVIDAGGPGGWDRTVSRRGAGLDPTQLEELLGTTKYRRLCCVRTVAMFPRLRR